MGTKLESRNIASGIPVQNAWYLLLYAWDMAVWRDNWSAESEQAPHLLGLLAKVLSGTSRKLLRNQLRRSFIRSAALVHGIRGRIDFAANLKRQLFERGVAHCIFPELNVDTKPNRIIRSTLSRLAAEPALTFDQPEAENALRHELRSLVREMEGIKLTPVTAQDFASLQFGRNDRDHGVPIAICRLIHTLRLPTEVAGDEVLAELLRDEILFSRLFERFIRNFYRLHLTNCRVDREQLDWFDELDSEFVPAMYTDMTIAEKTQPFKRTIVDTKYFVSALWESQHGGHRFKSHNLYQIYSYLRTQEHLSHSHRCASGLLLYPTNGYDVRHAMLVQGHHIAVATVNLAEPWQHIEKQLLSLLGA
jgi:5-methylcytosine-specific restriction enzyme subunit McrC